MTKILIVEDDVPINELLRETLLKAGYQVSAAFSGSEGKLLVTHESFDLILLDLMLPGMTGEELLQVIRQEDQVPVIVISAKGEIDEKVDLLQMGADDYLVKPFDLKELLARIQVCLKRRGPQLENLTSILTYQGLSYDLETNIVSYNGSEVSLTPQERKILELLMKDPKKIYSKLEIYEYAWGGTYLAEDKTLNVHMSHLRKKLNAITGQEWIQTVWGIGFRLRESEN